MMFISAFYARLTSLLCSYLASLCRANIRRRWQPPLSSGDEICRCRKSRNRRKHFFQAGLQRYIDFAWYRIWSRLEVVTSFVYWRTTSSWTSAVRVRTSVKLRTESVAISWGSEELEQPKVIIKLLIFWELGSRLPDFSCCPIKRL